MLKYEKYNNILSLETSELLFSASLLYFNEVRDNAQKYCFRTVIVYINGKGRTDQIGSYSFEGGKRIGPLKMMSIFQLQSD